jgi:hypothetical protein
MRMQVDKRSTHFFEMLYAELNSVLTDSDVIEGILRICSPQTDPVCVLAFSHDAETAKHRIRTRKVRLWTV